ncbi:hypothetical protein M426DRAFT_7771 [Hypoxylon sp. CI-4A]|nr:hypothetical protein M426DRAFT_7771 [Hypoxylon sp. CI-4A]
MSHPFSSTFDALQSHFTQKQSKPDQPSPQPNSNGMLPAQASDSSNNGVNTTTHMTSTSQSYVPNNSTQSPSIVPVAYPQQFRNDGLTPGFYGVSNQPHTAQSHWPPSTIGPPSVPQMPVHSTNMKSRRQALPTGRPSLRPLMPRPPPTPAQPPNPPSGSAPTDSPSPRVTPSAPPRETYPEPFPMPQAPASRMSVPQTMAPVLQAPSISTNTVPSYSAAQAIATEDEVDPMDTATDALLERQNDLNKDNPLPALPPIRGAWKKWINMEDKPQRSRGGRGGRGGRGAPRRGPRKAAEPTGDIKYRLNMASNAYMDGRIDEAIAYVNDAIRINAETYRAWILLASFQQEKGNKMGHYMARFMAAHLQPKIIDEWLQCAELAIGLRDENPDEADGITDEAIFCYSRAIRIENDHRGAHHGRAALQLEMGRLRFAAKDYTFLVEHCPYDVYAVRGLAEVCVLLADTGKAQFADKPEKAIEAYRHCIAHFRERGFDSRYPFEWQDVKIFVELLAYVGQFKDAIHELRSLSRWLLTRSNETFWDYQDDDREWDLDNSRRLAIDDYQDGKYAAFSYGSSLPLELRTKLAVYRLKLGQEHEAMRHLEFIDPDTSDKHELLSEYPHLITEAAAALYDAGNLQLALHYYEALQESDEIDVESLVRAGRCYLQIGDKRQAEECFTAAIEQDESESEACIDARYELAKMYEAAREEREAYILVNEAIRLQEARDQAREEAQNEDDNLEENDDGQEGDDEITLPVASLEGDMGADTGPKPKRAKRLSKPKAEKPKVSKKPREPKEPKERKPKAPANPVKRRRKLFANTEERQKEEKRRGDELVRAWQVVRDSRTSSDTDAQGPSDLFMSAARELIDDFKSYKDFYSWERYMAHNGIYQPREKPETRTRNPNLLAMVERLSHNLNPEDPNSEKHKREVVVSYRGVPFDEWLDLFLEYALGLAQLGKAQDSYKVCEWARDATVYNLSKEDMFLIHITWAACALCCKDEETCVAAARWIMREFQYDTEPFRFFSALSRLCPSPASWYASGPVQKYMLRQIKLMDRAITAAGAKDSGDEDETSNGRSYQSKELDITLLMVYGHILFISNSFTFALNYFMRAYSLDSSNSMVTLSVGHCYIHYALKRQSENRQYLLTQGFHFLHEYYNLKLASPDAAQRQEAHYNMARSYHAIGLPHLAVEYYRRALRDVPDDSGNGLMGRNDLTQEAAYNLQQICWVGGDVDSVKSITEQYLVL